jgi:hypothetical protein
VARSPAHFLRRTETAQIDIFTEEIRDGKHAEQCICKENPGQLMKADRGSREEDYAR